MAPCPVLHVLLIREWIHSVEPVRLALHAAGLDARITRVDLEPALHAALARGAFDLVLHDPQVAALPRDIVEAKLRARHEVAPIVTLRSLRDLATDVLHALELLRN